MPIAKEAAALKTCFAGVKDGIHSKLSSGYGHHATVGHAAVTRHYAVSRIHIAAAPPPGVASLHLERPQEPSSRRR